MKFHAVVNMVELVFQLFCFSPNFVRVCVCWPFTHVSYRKLQGVCVWAPEESGPWPGLPDTGREGTPGFNAETSRARMTHTYKETKHTRYYLLAPLLLTDASCPPVQTAQLRHHIDTRVVSLQADPWAR